MVPSPQTSRVADRAPFYQPPVVSTGNLHRHTTVPLSGDFPDGRVLELMPAHTPPDADKLIRVEPVRVAPTNGKAYDGLDSHRTYYSTLSLRDDVDGKWEQTIPETTYHFNAITRPAVCYAVTIHLGTDTEQHPMTGESISVADEWHVCIAPSFMEAATLAIWFTHTDDLETTRAAFNEYGVEPDPAGQKEVPYVFGDLPNTCPITGETEDLVELAFPFGVVPYLNGFPSTSSDIPYTPYVVPYIVCRVHERFRDFEFYPLEISMVEGEPVSYTVTDEIRDFFSQLHVTDVAAKYLNWYPDANSISAEFTEDSTHIGSAE